MDILINSLHISGNQQFDFDILNIAGTGKKLDALAKIKDCSIISKWKQYITNHMYCSAGSTQDNDGDMIVAKWESLTTQIIFSQVVFTISWKKMTRGKLSGFNQVIYALIVNYLKLSFLFFQLLIVFTSVIIKIIHFILSK